MSAVSLAFKSGLVSRTELDQIGRKKLKCTGEQSSCTRCVRERITCVYSAQKRMGRPKKRQRTDDEAPGRRAKAVRDTESTRQEQAWLLSPRGDTEGTVGANAPPLGDVDGYLASSGEELQPWLQSQDWTIPGEITIPGLTPDSSSNSPPLLDLPLELRSASSQAQGSGVPNDSNDHLLDPTLNVSSMGCLPLALPSCACLSTMYLTLNTLQQMPSFAFPFALHHLREAMQTASDVVACETCFTKFISAIQNTQLLGTLLVSIAERFSKVLLTINSETVRASTASETKKFRLADLNNTSSISHLHTGGLGCAAAFSIDLTPAEWRSMSKKVVRAEVHGGGPTDSNICCPTLTDLLKRMRERQESWHSGSKILPADFPLDREGLPIAGHRLPNEDHLCLKFVKYANKFVEEFDWS